MSQITFNSLLNTSSQGAPSNSEPNHGFSYANLLIAEQRAASSITETGKALAAIPQNEKEIVEFYVSQLVRDRTDCYDLWSCMSQDERDRQRDFHLSCCIFAVANIPSDQRAEIFNDALQFITPQMTIEESAQILKRLANIAPDQRAEIVHGALQLITAGTCAYESAQILESLANIAPDQRADIIQGTLKLLSCQEGVQGKSCILIAVSHIAPGQTAEVVELALKLVTQGEDPLLVAVIVYTLNDITQDQRAQIIEQALQLIRPGLNNENRFSILRKLVKLPSDERAEMIQLVLKVNNADPQAVMKEIGDISPNQRTEIVDIALQLITPQMSSRAQIKTISQLAKLPANERTEIVQLILNANRLDPGDMIEGLAEVRANERAQIFDLSIQLIAPEMFFFQKIEIMRRLVSIPVNERAHIAHLALQLINPEMGGWDRILIIRGLWNVPPDQRANYVQQQIHAQQGQLLQNAQAIAAQGLNVHANDRDERTRAAMELLRQHQGEIPRNRINEAVKEFIQYLNDREMDPQDKQLAQRALLAPKREDEVFGGLISQEPFTLLGLETSGEEVIGRLWIFLSDLVEPDRINAKVGMISALKNSYDHMGARVCDQGKTQRLLTAVLQGRLEGVNIELTEEMQIPTTQAIRMFFSIEAHQHIQQLEPLLEAARRFCDENTLIADRGGFLREIREYAEKSGFSD
jgi:hypothetical protein